MRNFDKLVQFLWENEKVRLDRKCWKGKKIGNPKTKLKGGVRVNNCVPKEAVTTEGEYSSSSGDNTTQGSTSVDNIGFKNNGPTFTVEKTQRDKVIDTSINFLEKLNKTGIPVEEEKLEQLISQLEKMAKSLFDVGIEPVDIIATIKNPRMAEQYLIKGPSAPGGGGKGALQDLKDIKSGLLTDDESVPGDDPGVNADIEQIDFNNYIVKPYLNDPNNGKDQPEGSLEENFKDGKNPGRKGLSKRVGVPTKASVSKLRSIAKNSSGEKARMAHWMANMKAGKAKKK